MVECSFCKQIIEQGTGKLFIKTDGRSLYFCSTKCEKNLLKLKRKSREHKWTGEFRQIKEKEEGSKTDKGAKK